MPVQKVGRKGKLDRDLPFRFRQTFAIFPNRSGGWGGNVLVRRRSGWSRIGVLRRASRGSDSLKVEARKCSGTAPSGFP